MWQKSYLVNRLIYRISLSAVSRQGVILNDIEQTVGPAQSPVFWAAVHIRSGKMAVQFGRAGTGARQLAKSRYIKVCLYAAIILFVPILLLLKSRFFPASGLLGLIGVLAAPCC